MTLVGKRRQPITYQTQIRGFIFISTEFLCPFFFWSLIEGIVSLPPTGIFFFRNLLSSSIHYPWHSKGCSVDCWNILYLILIDARFISCLNLQLMPHCSEANANSNVHTFSMISKSCIQTIPFYFLKNQESCLYCVTFTHILLENSELHAVFS